MFVHRNRYIFVYLLTMKTILGYILFFLLLLSPILSEARGYRATRDTLESLLSQREYYFDRQKGRIEQEEKRLLTTNDKRERFEICYNIFNLSRSYKYEIAYKYSNEALILAEEIGDPDLIGRAIASKISTFTSGGLFTEAADLVSGVDTSHISRDVKRELFYNIVRYYSDQIDYASQTEYKRLYTDNLQAYADSIIMLSPTKDYYYAYAKAYKELSNNNPRQAIVDLTDFYGSIECSDHHDSIITFLLGLAYLEVGEEAQGVEYLTKSVRHDVKAAARENRSIKTIAEYLFERDEVRISEKLINVAFEDAKFYNARHRNLEINTLLPIINRQKIVTISRQRNIVYGFFVVVTLLSIVAIVFGVIARRNANKIQQSKLIIQQQLQSISTINRQLVEANSIKEHYIVESLYKKSEHLKQMESLLKKIDVKVKNRLYDDLRYIYKDFNVKQERESFFSDFDGAFLRLFPNFIEEYNSLFLVEDQINISESADLPAEVRIFVLMRLGVTDNERISKFLDLSINTIYAYKTKVKNKTIIPKEEFDGRILQIKLSATYLSVLA